jgi:hypothetical protein
MAANAYSNKSQERKCFSMIGYLLIFSLLPFCCPPPNHYRRMVSTKTLCIPLKLKFMNVVLKQ